MTVHFTMQWNAFLSSYTDARIYHRSLFCTIVYHGINCLCGVWWHYHEESIHIDTTILSKYNIQYIEDIVKHSPLASIVVMLWDKRPKCREIDDGGGRRVCEIDSSWDLQQNNNRDISICLPGNEVWSGWWWTQSFITNTCVHTHIHTQTHMHTHKNTHQL